MPYVDLEIIQMATAEETNSQCRALMNGLSAPREIILSPISGGLPRKARSRSWSISIGANVEEAQAGRSRGDFISKYSIALKEARETIYWLRLLTACGIHADNQSEPLVLEAGEIARIIGAIIVNTKNGR